MISSGNSPDFGRMFQVFFILSAIGIVSTAVWVGVLIAYLCGHITLSWG